MRIVWVCVVFCGIPRHGAVFDSMGCYTILGILMAAELFVQVCGCDDALMPNTCKEVECKVTWLCYA